MTATSVVIAASARYRRLDVPRLDHFEKTSVYYAVSHAEALVRPLPGEFRRAAGWSGGFG